MTIPINSLEFSETVMPAKAGIQPSGPNLENSNRRNTNLFDTMESHCVHSNGSVCLRNAPNKKNELTDRKFVNEAGLESVRLGGRIVAVHGCLFMLTRALELRIEHEEELG